MGIAKGSLKIITIADSLKKDSRRVASLLKICIDIALLLFNFLFKRKRDVCLEFYIHFQEPLEFQGIYQNFLLPEKIVIN